MQSKGVIRLFAVLLLLASLYSLSFTFFTKRVESKAEEYATMQDADGNLYVDHVKENRFLDSVKNEVAYNMLITKFTYSECKEKELNFGLDLKGGMNVTMEVSVVDLIKALSTRPDDETFIAALNKAQDLQEKSQDDFVTLFGKAFEEVSGNANLAPYFANVDNKDNISYESDNKDVLKYLNKQAESAISNSYNILRTRIDRFGVTQPNIQSLAGGRILIELPGVKEPERVRKLLQGTAQLEFWETFDVTEVYQYFVEANEKIIELESLNSNNSEDTTTVEVAVSDSVAQSDSTADLSLAQQLEAQSTDSLSNSNESSKVSSLLSKLIISPDGKQLFGGPVIGIAQPKDTADINRYLALEQVRKIFPRNLKFFWTVKADEYGYYRLIAIKNTRDGKAPLDGEVITDANLEYGQLASNAQVAMAMNSEGASVWARLTKENIRKSIAIVLDGYVYSYPTVQNEISGGRSQITGNFTVAEATDLANVLKSGKLPAPAKILEEVVVGPSLGQEAINAGMWSFLIAFVLVIIYMIFYYNKAGMVADIALIVNVFLIFGVLSSMGAVLTLPGIAGIVLTLGMAVDANVLIYERIREELRKGRSLSVSIEEGYKNAYSAIIDSNVTSLLTGIVLYYFGSGPIQGFATTLIIGILTSLFSAIFISRLIFEKMLAKKKSIVFDTNITRNAFKNINIKFIENRKIAYAISGSLILICVVSMFVRGWDVGVDFNGGRSYDVRFDKVVASTTVADALTEQFGSTPNVKVYGEANQLRITTDYLITDKSHEADLQAETKLYEGLKPFLGDNVSYDDFIENYRMHSQKVGPTIADDIVYSAILAIFFSLIVMFLYIFMRFKDWQYGFGAVMALAHDVVILLGIFSLFYGILPFSLEIDQSFVAAILTVVGYSINDTVVVFDRIRENRSLRPNDPLASLMNHGLNSTLSRTFCTSLSTFIVLLAIFVFGGETVRGFVFAMMIGVVVGTYSSLFVASPITYQVMNKKEVENK